MASTKPDDLPKMLDRNGQLNQLKIAIDQFRKNKATAWKAARMASLSLTEFLVSLDRLSIMQSSYPLK